MEENQTNKDCKKSRKPLPKKLIIFSIVIGILGLVTFVGFLLTAVFNYYTLGAILIVLGGVPMIALSIFVYFFYCGG